MPKRRGSSGSRIYWRERGGQTRAYGDFRDFRDVGGTREALIPPGATSATTDPDVARELVSQRVKELEARRRNKVLLGVERQAALEQFAAHHLEQKARAGAVTTGWLEETEHQLRRAIEYFGADRDVASITPADCQRWSAHLTETPNGRGGTLAGGTIRHHLNALSNLYKRAVAEGYALQNPVAGMMEKPSAGHREAQWLEIHEAALLLEAARLYRPEREHQAIEAPCPLIATFLLTGGRKSEVLGLCAEDVSFDRGTVTFRPNQHRRLKTRTSHRSVPLWPQLREILQGHVFGAGRVSGLLFPSPAGRGMVTDVRKLLDALAERSGFAAGEIRTKMFRHTYCAVRLQTLDRGAPVAPWTVAKEMGHGGRSLVDRVYGHLGEVRHRSEVVEYRVEQHEGVLAERLTALRARQ